jgi:hypothetical protein
MKAYELQLQEQKNKKKKKVAIDANEAFATVEKIIATKVVVALQQPAWDERRKVREAQQLANVMLANHIAEFTHEFRVDDVVM